MNETIKTCINTCAVVFTIFFSTMIIKIIMTIIGA